MDSSSLKDQIKIQKGKPLIFKKIAALLSDPHNYEITNSLYTILNTNFPNYEKKLLVDSLTQYIDYYLTNIATQDELNTIQTKLDSLFSTLVNEAPEESDNKTNLLNYYDKKLSRSLKRKLHMKSFPVNIRVQRRIKLLVNESSLSLKKFSELCNLSLNKVSNILQCKPLLLISLVDLEKISQYSGKALSSLLSEDSFSYKYSYKNLYPIDNKLAGRIKEIQEEMCSGYTQFAKMTHVNRKTMSKIYFPIKDPEYISIGVLYSIARYTDCTVDYILGKTDNRYEYESTVRLTNGSETSFKLSITQQQNHKAQTYIRLFLGNPQNEDLYLLLVICFLLLPPAAYNTIRILIIACAKMHPNYRFSLSGLSNYCLNNSSSNYQYIFEEAIKYEHEQNQLGDAAYLYYYLYKKCPSKNKYHKLALVALGNLILYSNIRNVPIHKEQNEILKKYYKLIGISNRKTEAED